MFGQLFHELEVNVSASEAWELYGTLKLAEVAEEELKDMIEKIEVIEGNGEVGTLIKVTFTQDTPGFTFYKEKYTRVDQEKRVKEAEVIEGGFLEMGFTMYRLRFEIIEKGSDCCIIKSTVEYEANEEVASAKVANIINVEPVANLAEIAKNYLFKNKTITH